MPGSALRSSFDAVLMSSGSFFDGAFLVSGVVAALSLVSAAPTHAGEEPISVNANAAATRILTSFIFVPSCSDNTTRPHSNNEHIQAPSHHALHAIPFFTH